MKNTIVEHAGRHYICGECGDTIAVKHIIDHLVRIHEVEADDTVTAGKPEWNENGTQVAYPIRYQIHQFEEAIRERAAEPLIPPRGYTSWVDYAVDTMGTRDLHVESCVEDLGGVESHWGGGVLRQDFTDAVRAELEELRASSKADSSIRAALERKQGLIGDILSVPDVDWAVVKPEKTKQEDTNVSQETAPTTPPVQADDAQGLAGRGEN